MPVGDEGGGDDRKCGGDNFVAVQGKTRKKVRKRSMTYSLYQTRSHYKKKQHIQKSHIKCLHQKVTTVSNFMSMT